MNNNKVIVVGSYNIDITIVTDEFPKAGETVIGNNLTYGHGGKGANQAVASVRAGATTSLLAKVGADQNGDQAIKAMAQEGINTEFIQKATSVPTGMACITVNKSGENSIVVASGANGELSAIDVEEGWSNISSADVLLTQLETSIESVATAIRCARKEDVTVILNPAPVQALPVQLLSDVDIITPNCIEAELLTGISITDDQSLHEAANKLHAQGVPIVLITLGTRGVFLSSPDKNKLIPAIKVDAIDTVGAGDVFNGVLAALYSDVNSIEEIVSLAIIAAGLSVTKIGAQNAIPTLEEIKAYERKYST